MQKRRNCKCVLTRYTLQMTDNGWNGSNYRIDNRQRVLATASEPGNEKFFEIKRCVVKARKNTDEAGR